MASETLIENFGRNVRFRPNRVYTPKSEKELLEILDRHAGEQIRVGGSLHAWSHAARSEGIFLSLEHFNSVSVEDQHGERVAVVGAGCKVHDLVARLRTEHNLTTPSIGLIDKQSIAGAIATGTHGSGRGCLSSFVRSVRVAVYDADTGLATIRCIDSGEQLQAAQCSLGCLGVVVSVTMEVRPLYNVEETAKLVTSLDAVLELEQAYPLQQFYLLPWSWKILTHSRRESQSNRSWHASIYRWQWWLGIDVGLHVIILTLVQFLRSSSGVKFFFRHVLHRMVIRNWRVVDRSDVVLTMDHALFRHIEIEMFVTDERLAESLAYVQCVIRAFAGESDALCDWHSKLEEISLLEPLSSLIGTYTHHYPICVRKILPDDTLISPASGNQARYSISFISYQRTNDRDGYDSFAEFVAYSMAELFGARPHWGKVCPLDDTLIDTLYPKLSAFRDACAELDPSGRFSNEWTESRLRIGHNSDVNLA
ncbi:MAG: FAD-binding protein [Planctomycetales bacterium]|nr:FAD-binding protein [Planctomycetales bacterium]